MPTPPSCEMQLTEALAPTSLSWQCWRLLRKHQPRLRQIKHRQVRQPVQVQEQVLLPPRLPGSPKTSPACHHYLQDRHHPEPPFSFYFLNTIFSFGCNRNALAVVDGPMSS